MEASPRVRIAQAVEGGLARADNLWQRPVQWWA